MPITAKQRERRRRYLGASDVPTILGFNPWSTPAGVWAQKYYEIEEEMTSDAIDRGTFLEDGLIRWTCKKLGISGGRRNQFRVADNGIMACHLDFLIDGDPSPREAIECKTTANYQTALEYGIEFTDQVPRPVILQCQAQMTCANLTRVYVGALIFSEFKVYIIERDDELIATMEKLCLTWWEKYVIAGVEPPDSTPPESLLKHIRRDPDSWTGIDEKLVHRYEIVKAASSKAKKRADELKAQVIAALGTAEGARLSDGRTVTYLEQRGKNIIDETALKTQYPEVYAAVASPNSYRVLRIKKAKHEKGVLS